MRRFPFLYKAAACVLAYPQPLERGMPELRRMAGRVIILSCPPSWSGQSSMAYRLILDTCMQKLPGTAAGERPRAPLRRTNGGEYRVVKVGG